MIVGDPNKFAMSVDIIDEWNVDDTFNNGIMFFIINAIVFPQQVNNITLNVNVREVYKSFQNIGVNTQIFYMDKDDAFKALYKLVYPEDLELDNDYRFEISPYEFNDFNHLVFAVSNGKYIRFLASSLVYDIKESICLLENIDIIESFITVEDLKKIILDIEIGEMKKFI